MNKFSERRSSLRRPIYHDALMKVDEELSLGCVIADFCLDGMFIKFMSGAANRVVDLPEIYDRHIPIELSFTGEKGQVYTLKADIVHHVSGACGLHFSQRYDQAIQTLINLSTTVGLPADKNMPVKQVLTECIHYINTVFGPLMQDYWALIDEELRAVAVRASNDQTANALMALAEKIKTKRADLQLAVMNGIEDPVAAFNLHLERRKTMNNNLSIVDKTEFEDWLVSRVLVMRCETEYQSSLMPLKLRLDALGVGDKRHHQSVFGPALLINAFHSVVHSLDVDSATEKLFFRVFEQKVMLALNGFYDGLNDILIKHNILPKLKIKQTTVAKRAAAKKSNEASLLSDSAPEKKSTPNSDNQKQQSGSNNSRSFTLPPFSGANNASGHGASFSENQQVAQSALSNITNLLHSLRGGSPVDDQQSRELYSPAEFEQGLSELQRISVSSVLDESPKSLLERVQENLLQSGEEKALDDNKKTAIDVVDRFFLSMRNNPRLSTEAKQSLLKLEVPVLKVLLKDERFFEDQQSSVRAVMNRIAQLGAKGANLNAASKDKVEKLVQKIIVEFEDDTTVFDAALAELDQLIERQNTLYVKNVERVAAAADGTLKVEEANLATTDAINERIAHKFVPTAVVTLINEGWKEYLNLTYIKHGEKNQHWCEALNVIDQLIAYGNDPRQPIDIKVILPKIQEGLKLVSGTNEASIRVRDSLKAFVLNAPKGKHLSEKAQQLQLPETEDDLLSRNTHKSQVLKNWIVKIKSIPLGSWMKLSKQDDSSSYMRLVWVAKGFSKFVFVNHQGMKVIELGLFKLANYFKEGRITVEPDYELPIVNQGLDDMVKDVYDKLAYESSHDVCTGLINRAEFCRQVRLVMKKGKRTSACSLLFIHFRDTKTQALELTESFAKQVVARLEQVSESGAIMGRISETDFVIFNATDDSERFKSASLSALIKLCQQPENIDAGLMVTVGESRAHLGFNNPESMIQHAQESIQSDSSTIDEASEANASSATECDELENQVINIDEAANTELNAAAFSSLKFDIWGQDASEIIHKSSGDDSAQGQANIKSSAQLNLLCVIQGAKQTYSPENEACSKQLDKWWIQKLLDIHRTEPELFHDYQMIRVKLSAFVFNSDDLVERLVVLAHKGELKAAQICFDVYDCFEIDNVEFAVMRMKRLKNIGFSFCLDHFGSDRSPFAYLKALPVDMIKIDDVFVAALNQNEEAGEVAADSIVEIAHYMGKKVLATEVDSAVCLQKMKHLKVDYVQGSTISDIQKYEL